MQRYPAWRCRHVLVIPRLTQRLADARQRMEEVGVAYELLNGTDGREPIPAALLDLYLGPRLRDLVLKQHDQHWVMMAASMISHVQVGRLEPRWLNWWLSWFQWKPWLASLAILSP